MRDDLVSRQAVMESLTAEYNRRFIAGDRGGLRLAWIEGAVDSVPTAHPKMGKWIPDTMCYYEERFICSECKGNYKVDTCMGKPMWKWCPNCGARMMEVTE